MNPTHFREGYFRIKNENINLEQIVKVYKNIDGVLGYDTWINNNYEHVPWKSLHSSVEVEEVYLTNYDFVPEYDAEYYQKKFNKKELAKLIVKQNETIGVQQSKNFEDARHIQNLKDTLRIRFTHERSQDKQIDKLDEKVADLESQLAGTHLLVGKLSTIVHYSKFDKMPDNPCNIFGDGPNPYGRQTNHTSTRGKLHGVDQGEVVFRHKDTGEWEEIE